MFEALEFDWFILLLRLLFIFLLYFFLYQVVRVTTRELIALATNEPAREVASSAARLVVVDGAESGLAPGTTFALQSVNQVGRHRDCTIMIDEPFVSAEHAEMAYDNGRWWLRDLGSTNGTFINGNRVGVATGVRPGDIVQFGRITLQFVPSTR